MSKTKKSSYSSEEFSSSSYSSSSLSSDEEIDARDLKPIKDYLTNRRELARQLFKSVKPDKIRMMLPQVLKKIYLEELEEWCASELSGMSKTRILCILNGKPMLESSDTSESDESGPSLEIISDTEEWLTEDDNIKKEEGMSGKTKVKKHKSTSKVKSQSNNKKEDAASVKAKAKSNNKDGGSEKSKDVKVKKEPEKETGKEKEADSLLDLLELEMRARAIRALIRKEDDIIPSTNESKTLASNSTEDNSSNKSRQEELNAKENCRRQLEKIISSQQMDGDEEDVMLVVQPTPTIELLSSESETEEGGTRINQKLENERKLETEKSTEKLDNKNNAANPTEQASKDTRKITDGKETNTKISAAIDDTYHTSQDKNSSSSTSIAEGTTKRKKVKKKSRSKNETRSEGSATANGKAADCTEKTEDKIIVVEEKGKELKNITKEEKPIPSVSQAKPKMISDEDKLADFEEIIDLDNYSDDMDDLENCDNEKGKSKDNEKVKTKDLTKEQKKLQVQPPTESNLPNSQKSKSAETWATRYYQTDDVQNVIKESKIQSEIRKRLRERQRLSKLSSSPSVNSSSPSRISEIGGDKIEPKPTGSVEEYLALKQATQVTHSSDTGGTTANSPEKDKSTDAYSETSKQEVKEEKSNVTSVNNDV